MIKKIEANKSSVPRGQMFIKHLSPMHNLKAAKNFDIVSPLKPNEIETLQSGRQTIPGASCCHKPGINDLTQVPHKYLT
jgi:hypothetical protein